MLGGVSGDRFASINRGFRELFRSLGGSDSEDGISGTILVDPAHLHLVAPAADVSPLIPAPGRPTRLERVLVPFSAGNHCVMTVTPTTRELVLEYLNLQGLSGGTAFVAYVELIDAASVDPITVGKAAVAPAAIRSLYAVPTTFELAIGHQAPGTYPNSVGGTLAPAFGGHGTTTTGICAETSAHFAMPRIPVGHRLVVAHLAAGGTVGINIRVAEAVGVPAAL